MLRSGQLSQAANADTESGSEAVKEREPRQHDQRLLFVQGNGSTGDSLHNEYT
jgi:hypothetical protein